MNFNEYLQTVFDKQFHGSKDEIEDAYEYWICNLQVDKLIDYADLYAEQKVGDFIKNNTKQ